MSFAPEIWQTAIVVLFGGGGVFALMRSMYRTNAQTLREVHESSVNMAEGIAARAIEREKYLEQRVDAYRKEAREEVTAYRSEAAEYRCRYEECDRDRADLRRRLEVLECKFATITPNNGPAGGGSSGARRRPRSPTP